MHPPDQLQLAGHLVVVGDRQDRRAWAKFAHIASCGTAIGERQDGCRIKLPCHCAHRLTDRIRDCGGHVAVQDSARVVALNPAGHRVHGGHGFHWEVPHGALIGEHHRVGAIENRVGHITHLGAGGPRAAHHRVEHLGGGDHRDPEAVALADQFLLQQRHLLGGHLHPQVAAGHHHPIAEMQDVIDLIDGFKFFNFCHHRRGMAMAGNQLLDLQHVGGVAHKAERHPVHPLLQPEGQIGAVLVGEGPDRELHIGEVHPLVVGEHPAHGHPAVEVLLGLINPLHNHLHPAVIQQDAAARQHLVGELVVGNCGDFPGASHLAGGKAEGIPLGQGDRAIGKAAETNLGALQVLQDAHVHAQGGGHLANRGDAGGMLAVVAMGKIQPEGGGAGLDQLAQPLRGFGGRADGGHDLGATHEIGLGHGDAIGSSETTIAPLWRCSCWTFATIS